MIFFERLMQEFDTLFDYNFQEVPKLNILNISIIQSEYGIIIDQKKHIIKKHYSGILGNKDKIWSKVSEIISRSGHFLWKTLFLDTSLIGEELKNWELTWRIPKSLSWFPRAHHCSNLLWLSISYHVFQWIHKCPGRAWLTCSHKRYGIYHATSTLTYNVLKKKNSKKMKDHINVSSKQGIQK